MRSQNVQPWGTWRSPLSAEKVAAASARVANPWLDNGVLYYVETRPHEGGRTVLMARDVDARQPREVLPDTFSVRSRVHEYGGVAYTVVDGCVWFVNYADQDLYVARPGERPVRLTRDPGLRLAEPVHDAARQRVICVAERLHEDREPEASLVAVDANSGQLVTLHQGHDFYTSPRISPDGQWLAWLCWDHPRMPWDGTMLQLARLDAPGLPGEARCIAGGEEESVFQPEFHPAGGLIYVSDRSNWWNLYHWLDGRSTALCPMEAEFGLPQWVFGMRTWAVCGDGSLLCAWSRNGNWRLGRYRFDRGLEDLGLPWSEYGGVVAEGNRAALIAASAEEAPLLLQLNINARRVQVEPLRQETAPALPAHLAPPPRPVRFASGDGEAHALFYAPAGDGVSGPTDSRPPLLVKCHGGPTGAASTALDPRIRFWTSRGFAVLDVNYRGSTGYGRRYRHALYGRWGEVDVEDCLNGARHLAAAGEVDPARMVISGSSAGGFTVLCALCFHDVFAAGASYYGIGDLAALARDTHKFESRYTDNLVGPWPQAREIYQQRSPLHHIERFRCPVIFFQGEEDRIVPPNQAKAMVDALQQAGIATEYWLFDGEAHGFRRAETMVTALDAELAFYQRVLGLDGHG